MKLIDFYLDSLLMARNLVGSSELQDKSKEEVKDLFCEQLNNQRSEAVKSGYPNDAVESALFPVIALIDEMLLTSNWHDKENWQRDSLQRLYFQTTNAGNEFYSRLNLLNRQGLDREVREVYLLCLGLGFKGQYFRPSDRPKIEQVRVFNLDLLLPKDAKTVFSKTRLFDEAYHQHQQLNSDRKTRVDLTPLFVTTPIVLIVSVLVYYALNISGSMTEIMELVK